jgi:hypothetical protein
MAHGLNSDMRENKCIASVRVTDGPPAFSSTLRGRENETSGHEKRTSEQASSCPVSQYLLEGSEGVVSHYGVPIGHQVVQLAHPRVLARAG